MRVSINCESVNRHFRNYEINTRPFRSCGKLKIFCWLLISPRPPPVRRANNVIGGVPFRSDVQRYRFMRTQCLFGELNITVYLKLSMKSRHQSVRESLTNIRRSSQICRLFRTHPHDTKRLKLLNSARTTHVGYAQNGLHSHRQRRQSRYVVYGRLKTDIPSRINPPRTTGWSLRTCVDNKLEANVTITFVTRSRD